MAKPKNIRSQNKADNSAEIGKFNALAHQWWDENGAMKPLHSFNPHRLNFVQQQAGTLAQKPILDVGCGGGIFAEALCRAGGEVTGIDLADDLLSVAKQHAAQNKLNINYQRQSIEQLAQSQAQFAVVCASEVLEHVDDVPSFIGAMAKLVAPKGGIFISTLNRTKLSYALGIIAAEYVLGLLPRGTHDWQKFLKPAEIADMLAPHGFIVKRVQGLAYNPFDNSYKATNSAAINYLLWAQQS